MLQRAVNSISFRSHRLANKVKDTLRIGERYCIKGSYVHREEYCYFDDTETKETWQKEVYERAEQLARREQLKTVYDVGCGSGFKLMKHFRNYRTIGFDVPETLPLLQKTYSDREWRHVPFSDRTIPPADLVICADVIEHVANPGELLEFLKSIASKWIAISTPDRLLLHGEHSPGLNGPPNNPCHFREWSFDEFERYVSKFLTIDEHVITNRKQATQMIIATV